MRRRNWREPRSLCWRSDNSSELELQDPRYGTADGGMIGITNLLVADLPTDRWSPSAYDSGQPIV